MTVDEVPDGSPEVTAQAEQGEVGLAALTFFTTSARSTQVRSGPSNGSSLVRVLPAHSKVTVLCQTTGQSVSGPFGTSTIWDRIGVGQYVSDAFVFTGSDGFVAPRC